MISKEEFLVHIEQTIIPMLKKQEKERRYVLFQSVVIGLIGVTLSLFLAWLGLTTLNEHKSFNDNSYIKASIFTLIIFTASAGWLIDRFMNKIKGKANEKVLNLLGLAGTPPKEHLSLKRLCSLNFFKYFDEKEIEDSFYSLNKPFYAVHELTLIKKQGKNTDTFFQGQVLYYSAPQPYATPVMILKRRAMLTPTICKSKEVAWQEVTLEDTEFNQEYRIFAQNQIGARVVLSPRFMEKLKDIKNTYNASFRILFIDNYFVIAINTRKDMFEFYTVAQKPSLKQFAQFYDEIKVLTDLVETLDFK